MKRIRLVKMVCQPVLVVDDGTDLEPLEVAPIAVSAADWPTFATEKWLQDLATTETQINEPEQSAVVVASLGEEAP